MGTGIFISSERLFSGNFHSYEGILPLWTPPLGTVFKGPPAAISAATKPGTRKIWMTCMAP